MNRFKYMSRTSKGILEIIRIGLAMAGVFLLIDGGKAYEAYVSRSWPTTTGEITRSAVEIRSNALQNRSYYSTIKYAYTVAEITGDDDNLIGNRISVDPIPPADSRATAEAQLIAYPEGSAVTVYYNPNRLEKSLLEPKFLLRYLILPVVGFLCLGIALRLWIAEWVTS